MPRTLELGRRVTVAVPATSANLGPGFDSLGLALGWYETITLEVTASGYVADVSGEGAAALPRDERHLVLASALRACAMLDVTAPGLRLSADNTIPHGRGLGSSSAAIVSGLLAATALAGAEIDRPGIARLANEIEGHPDNVAAAVHGGAVVAYVTPDGLRVTSLTVHEGIKAVVFVPDTPVSTSTARGLLPVQVPHADAAANAGRAALLVAALAGQPELLFDATEDRLHQGYRSGAMPESYALLESLRNKGKAAVISGAGPTILVLGPDAELAALEAESAVGFRAIRLDVGAGARVVD